MMEFSSPGLQLFSLFIFKEDTSSIIELNLSCYLCQLEEPLAHYSSLPDFLLFPHSKEEDVITGVVS